MWKRREILGALGTGAASLALLPTATATANSGLDDSDAKNAAMKKSCCDACGDCAEACNKAYHYCLEQASAGKSRHAKIAQTIADCAAFCDLSADTDLTTEHHDGIFMSGLRDACRQCARNASRLIRISI